MEIGGNTFKLINLICLFGTVTNCWDISRFDPYNQFVFRCQDTGRYILHWEFCNGVKNCDNGEDEIYGCNKNVTCEEDQKYYVCDQQCKQLSVRCNGIKDCEDGTDELNCGNGIDVKNCTGESKFLCKDGLKCIDLYSTCDKRCNCFDCSDENYTNCQREDYNLRSECADSYFHTAKGPKCYCNSSNDDFKTWCNSIRSCTSDYTFCGQRCIQIEKQVECSCFEGFHRSIHTDDDFLLIDPLCRKNDWFETVIAYSTGSKIKLLNVTSNIASTIQDKVYNITALAIANNYIYYALKLPDDEGCIFKTSVHSRKSERIINTGLNVTSLAVDYITNNVYFTTNGTLSVCKNDGSMCLELECCDIREVALAPKSGLMFYLKKEPKLNGFVLTKSNMVGDDKTTSVDKVYRADIFSLVVDESAAKLYLLKIIHNAEKSKIHQFALNTGLAEKTMIGGSVKTLDMYDSRIFFARSEKGFENTISFTISMENFSALAKYNGWLPYPTYHTDHDNSTNISHLKVNNAISHNSNENPCDKSSCSGLCLIRPGNSSKFLSYTCLCDNFTSTAVNRFCS